MLRQSRHPWTLAITAVILVTATLPVIAKASDAKPPDRATATKILSAMNYKKITIGAIFKRGDAVEVLAVGTQDGKPTKIDQTLSYDEKLGWSEVNISLYDAAGGQVSDFQALSTRIARAQMQIWSASGYSVISCTP